jgi:hypothetical protein
MLIKTKIVTIMAVVFASITLPLAGTASALPSGQNVWRPDGTQGEFRPQAVQQMPDQGLPKPTESYSAKFTPGMIVNPWQGVWPGDQYGQNCTTRYGTYQNCSKQAHRHK